jgi:hypothetical protein
MQGARFAAHRAALINQQDRIRNSKLTETPKFHVYRHFGTALQNANTRNARNKVDRTRAALEDPPRPAINRVEVPYELDSDLYGVLSLATDDELEELYSSLYSKQLARS